MKYFLTLAVLLSWSFVYAGGSNPDVPLHKMPPEDDGGALKYIIGAAIISALFFVLMILSRMFKAEQGPPYYNLRAKHHLENPESINLTVSEKRLKDIKARQTQTPSEIKKPL